MSFEIELKPCPFCGGKASFLTVEQTDGTRGYEVSCENAACEVCSCTMLHPTKAEAAAAWNRRPQQMTVKLENARRIRLRGQIASARDVRDQVKNPAHEEGEV